MYRITSRQHKYIKYPWLDPDDIRRNMTDKEILRMKLNLKDSVLDEKGNEEF